MRAAVARPLRFILLIALLLMLGVVSFGCAGGQAQFDSRLAVAVLGPPPTEPPTVVPTATAVPTDTATPTDTPTDTPAPTDTSTPTGVPTDTPTASPTRPPTLTHTPAPATPTAASVAPLITAPPVANAHVPILMYHYISEAGEDRARLTLSVPPDVFRAQMRYLSEHGFQTIHLMDLVNHLQTGAPLPPRAVILTFDDGYEDNYQNAFPVLKEFGFTGTFFIIANRPDSGLLPGYMSWQEIQELAANGMEIGSHSYSHGFNLGRVARSLQSSEISQAKDLILAHLPSAAPVFAYPSGSYSATTIDLLRQNGYVAAVTINDGVMQYSNGLLELRRVRVMGYWNIDTFVSFFTGWTKGM